MKLQTRGGLVRFVLLQTQYYTQDSKQHLAESTNPTGTPRTSSLRFLDLEGRYALCSALALWSGNEETRAIRLVACIAATGVTNTEGTVPNTATTGMAL